MRTLAVITALIAWTSCSPQSSASEPVLVARAKDPEALARGRALFLANCALCHGVAADGRGARRADLSRPPPSFKSPTWRAGVRPETVLSTIRDGKPGTSMPSWRSLEDAEIVDLAAYVWSVGAAP